MKCFLVLLFFMSQLVMAQIPNNSFENWTGGDPVDWWTTDVVGVIDAVTQTSDAWEGNSAALMTILAVGPTSFIPSLSVGDFGSGTPVSERYGSMTGYYKLSPMGTEDFNVSVLMMNNQTLIGSGGNQFPAAGSWTQFSIPITYISGDTPDLAIITINIAEDLGAGTPGTFGTVDYLMFGPPTTGVTQIDGLPQDYSLKQNYPNPFNPSTNIEYSIPSESLVQLNIYDVLGNKVATLVNEVQQTGTYNAEFIASDLPSGMYFARISASNFTKVVKMTLLK